MNIENKLNSKSRLRLLFSFIKETELDNLISIIKKIYISTELHLTLDMTIYALYTCCIETDSKLRLW